MKRPVLLLDGLIVVALLSVGLAIRLHCLPWMQLDENTIFPYSHALFLVSRWAEGVHGGVGAPDASWFLPQVQSQGVLQFGPGLFWTHVPLIAGASSLQEVLVRRLLLQTLAAPLFYGVARATLGRTDPRRGSFPWPSVVAALVGAVAVGLTGFPFGPLSPYDDTYLAPDLCNGIAVSTLLVLLARRPRWFLVALPLLALACMVHPFSVSYAAGAAVVVVLLVARGKWRVVAGAVALAAILALAEVAHLWNALTLFSTDLGAVSQNCDERAHTLGTLFSDTMRYMTWLTPRPMGWVLCGSLLVAPVLVGLQGWSRWKREPSRGWRSALTGEAELTIWCWANVLGFFVALWLIGCLQQWHWGILLPSLAAQLAVVVHLLLQMGQRTLRQRSRRGATVLGVAILVGTLTAVGVGVGHRWADCPRGYSSLQACRWVDETVRADAGGESYWIEAMTMEHTTRGYPWLYATAVILEQRLGDGGPPRHDTVGSPLYLVTDATADEARELAGLDGWQVPPAEERRVGESGSWSGGQPSTDIPAVSLVGMYEAPDRTTLLLVRIADSDASRRWTRSLCERFPYNTVRTHYDSVDYSGVFGEGGDVDDVAFWFDPCVAMDGS